MVQSLSNAELVDRLRLIRSQNVGPITFRNLIARYGNATKALENLPDMARKGGRKQKLKTPSKAEAEKELAMVAQLGGAFLVLGTADYPPALAAIEDPPPLLCVLGHRHLLVERNAVAIVGTRNASANGRHFAEKLAHDLGQIGWLIVSGMARGIDSSAHTASLNSGSVAVLAGGIDNIYPPENEDLYVALADQGVLVTERPFGAVPMNYHFPQRNRIISGLSLGVVVIEAALHSGSLITARIAGIQGREVMAVPGFPSDPRSAGTNQLIQEGAALINGVDDVLQALSNMTRRPLYEPESRQNGMFGSWEASLESGMEAFGSNISESDLDQNRETLIKFLGSSPVAVDELIRQCQISTAIVRILLVELELAGRLDRQPGDKVALLDR